MPGLDPAIAAYYGQALEETRLEQLPFVLEEIRTRELIQRHAPAPPAFVLDVGGAAGFYATWLADLGYTVHLVDAVPRLVAEAERRSKTLARPLASCRVGDARDLEFPDASADVVLLLGPLYHLTEASDRARALHEAVRVLKPGGLLFAAAISRYASALDGTSRDVFRDPRFGAIVEQDLKDGQHRNPTERIDYFTTAFFHRPEDLRAEVDGAGLALEGLYGLEGPGWFLTDLADRWADPRRRADLLQVARQLESQPSARGISAHLLAVARKFGRQPDIPVACLLTEPELRKRRETVLAAFREAQLEVRELRDASGEGYAFRLESSATQLATLAELIELERQCCPFLRFQLTLEPGSSTLWLALTGRPGTRELLTHELGFVPAPKAPPR